MSPEWKDCLVGDVVNLKRGYDLPKSKRQKGSVPIVSSAGISDFHSQVKVKGPGVVTGRYGTIGNVYFIKEDFFPLNTTLYVQDFKGNHERFISYFLETIDFWSCSDKAAVPGVNRNHLHLLEAKLPPLQEQKAIAYILGTLDEKIEQNRKTNETLEGIAKALFKSWFIHFDPVRAKAEGRSTGLPNDISELFPDSFEDSELGEIPSGWKVKKLSELFDRLPVGKKFNKNSVNKKGSTPVIDQSANGVIGYHNEKAGVTASMEKPLFTFANHTCAMRLMMQPFSVIQNVFPIRGKKISTIWLYQGVLGKQKFSEYKGHYPDLIEKELIIPSGKLDEFFQEIVLDIYRSIFLKSCGSSVLKECRDALLPKLISGELRVPDAEKMIEELGI